MRIKKSFPNWVVYIIFGLIFFGFTINEFAYHKVAVNNDRRQWQDDLILLERLNYLTKDKNYIYIDLSDWWAMNKGIRVEFYKKKQVVYLPTEDLLNLMKTQQINNSVIYLSAGNDIIYNQENREVFYNFDYLLLNNGLIFVSKD
ncbi:MAG: hypothetical protein WCJ58_01365 [bacterium]